MDNKVTHNGRYGGLSGTRAGRWGGFGGQNWARVVDPPTVGSVGGGRRRLHAHDLGRHGGVGGRGVAQRRNAELPRTSRGLRAGYAGSPGLDRGCLRGSRWRGPAAEARCRTAQPGR